jgi:peptide/nickel transport system permease protein
MTLSDHGRHNLRRIGILLPIGGFTLSLLAFNIPKMIGIDPAEATLRTRYGDPNPDPTTLLALRSELGLDESGLKRYLRFLSDAVTGDFGLSFSSRLPVGPTAGKAFIVSLQLLVPSVILALLFGLLLGVGGSSQRRRVSSLTTSICVCLASLPAHVVGPLAVLVSAVFLRLLPTGGWGSWQQAVLPVGVLAIGPSVSIAEVVRAEMVRAMNAPFIRTARSKGLTGFAVTRHAFSVSRHGLMAVGGVVAAGLLSGSVLVETIFSVPGLGRYLVDAVRTSDVPAMQCGLMIAAFFSNVVGCLVELCAVATDPRLRHSTR